MLCNMCVSMRIKRKKGRVQGLTFWTGMTACKLPMHESDSAERGSPCPSFLLLQKSCKEV